MKKNLQSLNIALTALKSQKSRTFLASLGIVIGIAAVIIMVAIGQGSQQQVMSVIAKMGENLVTINAGSALGQHLLVLLFCLTRWPGISVAISTGNAVPTLHFLAMRWNEISHRQATGNNSARAVSRAWPHPKPPITQPAPGLLCPC